MTESVIPVDLWNPGQVFACLGIMEASDILLGKVVAAFDWKDGEATFQLSAAGSERPVERVLRFLEESEVLSRVPTRSRNNLKCWKKSWGETPEIDSLDSPFPFPDPNTFATVPGLLRDRAGNEIAIEYWGDATERDNVKFWAGSGGYPGVALLRDTILTIRNEASSHVSDPFSLPKVLTSSFRFDWRRDYIPIQDGFSPNKHGKTIQMVGFPLVEILAAIGMTNARPNRRTKLEYSYGVLGNVTNLLDPVFHRVALGADRSPVPGMPFRRFLMHLDWPDQEGIARCITQVNEEETTKE